MTISDESIFSQRFSFDLESYKYEFIILLYGLLKFRYINALIREIKGSCRITVVFSKTSISLINILLAETLLLNNIDSIDYVKVHCYLGSKEYQADVVVVNIVEKYLSAVCFYADAFGESLSATSIRSLCSSWDNSTNEYVKTSPEARDFSAKLLDNGLKDDEAVYCIIYSPIGNVVLEKVIDNLTKDSIIKTFMELVIQFYTSLFSIAIGSMDDNYILHLKLIKSELTSSIRNILFGEEAQSVGLVCHGVTLSYKLINSTTSESIIIPNTKHNNRVFARKEFCIQDCSQIADDLIKDFNDAHQRVVIIENDLITLANKSLLINSVAEIIYIRTHCIGDPDNGIVCTNPRSGNSTHCCTKPCNLLCNLRCIGDPDNGIVCPNPRHGGSTHCCTKPCNLLCNLRCIGDPDNGIVCTNPRLGNSTNCGRNDCCLIPITATSLITIQKIKIPISPHPLVIQDDIWQANVNGFISWKKAILKRTLTKRDSYKYEESEYTVDMGPKIVNMGPFFVKLVSNKYRMAILNEDQKKFLVENFSIIELE